MNEEESGILAPPSASRSSPSPARTTPWFASAQVLRPMLAAALVLAWSLPASVTAQAQSRGVPGPSDALPPDLSPTMQFAKFPDVYELPWHYAHPVTGRPSGPSLIRHASRAMEGTMTTGNGSPGSTSDPERMAGSIPLHIATELLEIGPRIEAQRTGELYAPLHRVAPFPGVNVHRDIAYGDHERQVLDVFTTQAGAVRKPVLVFLHGGGFSRGAKSVEGSPFYDNVPLWAAENGFVGVNINYRLAPEFTWPSGIEDLTALVVWLRGNITDHGGDPESIFLWGHSAGAAHVADYIAWHTLRDESPGIAGAILLSGFYDLGDEVSQWEAYYGDDVTTYPQRSSLPGLVRSALPLLVVDAQLDPEYFQIEADRLTRERAAAGRPVRRLHLPGHSHLSEGYAVGTADRSLTDPVLQFVREQLSSR
jgi:acetyl esterase/lipase